MILHTILPQELIFGSEMMECKEEYLFSVDGIPVLCEPVNSFEMRITKLLSTDPNHYLQSNLYPGAILSLGKF